VKTLKILFVGLYVILFAGSAYPNSELLNSDTLNTQKNKIIPFIEIEKILETPREFEGKHVKVKGTVVQLIARQDNTKYYVLKSDFGRSIRIQIGTGQNPPETMKKYIVEGVLYYDSNENRFAISEISRLPFISENASDLTAKRTIETSKNEKIINEEQKNNLLRYLVGGGLSIIILAIVMVSFIKKRNKKRVKDQEEVNEISEPASEIYFAPTMQMDSSSFSTENDFKTIKIALDSPQTLKLIPGKLVIVSGEDKGKFFSISGYATAEGAVVTIGREEVPGERAYSHIQLKQKTVSRKQAELIYKDSKLYVKNLSETNYTCLDGEELNSNQLTEVKEGSVIKTGEVEFKYEI